jgi:hypothetical protein
MIRAALLTVAGLVMLLSAAAHGMLGWPAMSQGLADAGAPADLAGGLAAGWYWGSVAMIAFGLIVLAAALRVRRGDPSLNAPVLMIAVCYVMFGLAAFVARHNEPFFFLFVATGLLAGLPVAGPASRRR